MPFVNEREELERFEFIPILCVHCGRQRTIAKPSAEVLDALYEVSFLFALERELALLQRTKALFDSLPDSRHPQKMCKEFLSKEERPKMEADPEFDKALNADPELRTFLYRSSFWLPARMKGVVESIQKQEQLDVHLIGCNGCSNGHFCIEPGFLNNIT